MSGIEPKKSTRDLSLAGYRRFMDSPASVIVPTLSELQQGQRQRLKELQQEEQRQHHQKKFMAPVEEMERATARRRTSMRPRENHRSISVRSVAGPEPMTGNARVPRGSENERSRPNDPWHRVRRGR